jgi:Putative MetA-pathway of phenol degradation
MVEPVRHRQTKGAATNMFNLQLPRHIPTLPKCEILRESNSSLQCPQRRTLVEQRLSLSSLPAVALVATRRRSVQWRSGRRSAPSKGSATGYALARDAFVPVGKYEPMLRATKGIGIGNNIWDFAPAAAVSYTTPPLLAEGTEVSAKLYWNNYGTNPDTQHKAASLLDVVFAVTEAVSMRSILGAARCPQLEVDRK